MASTRLNVGSPLAGERVSGASIHSPASGLPQIIGYTGKDSIRLSEDCAALTSPPAAGTTTCCTGRRPPHSGASRRSAREAGTRGDGDDVEA